MEGDSCITRWGETNVTVGQQRLQDVPIEPTVDKERDEDLLCEHPLKILSEMLRGSFEKSFDVETEDPQEDLAAEHPREAPVERVLSVISAEAFTETNGNLEDLEEDVPEQTSSEEASGVHMMRVDPATLAKIPPGHLQAWSSDSEDEEDPEDVERSSGVTEKERDEDLLCEHPLKILSEMLRGSFEKSFDVETEDPQEDLAAEHPREAPVERVLSVISAEAFTETNGTYSGITYLVRKNLNVKKGDTFLPGFSGEPFSLELCTGNEVRAEITECTEEG
ncbi:uncharacterized protein [Chlorocebus sabaeus]|uniref:uncharacterized protein isoform X2 n=1 Tax=Chlorocebus sabaeus TaxID=60711 RepID=UPI003BF9F894